MIRAALRCSALVLCAFVAAKATALAWVPHTATIAAVKVTTPPKLDLTLEDPLWKTGAVFDNFYNFTSHQPAEHETVAYLLYDDENLYLAIHNAQHGASIVATQTVDHAGVA